MNKIATTEPWAEKLYVAPKLCKIDQDGLTDCFGVCNNTKLLLSLESLHSFGIDMALSVLMSDNHTSRAFASAPAAFDSVIPGDVGTTPVYLLRTFA